MSALIDPKIGDVVETQDGVRRVVRGGPHSGYYSASVVHYTTTKQGKDRRGSCWRSTWQEWCKRNKAIEVTK
jgi:hypothetical protein